MAIICDLCGKKTGPIWTADKPRYGEYEGRFRIFDVTFSLHSDSTLLDVGRLAVCESCLNKLGLKQAIREGKKQKKTPSPEVKP